MSSMSWPSIVTRKRLPTTTSSSPFFCALVPLLERRVAADGRRLLVAVARLAAVAGRQQHRPRRDQHLREAGVDDLHVDARVALLVCRLDLRERQRRRHALALGSSISQPETSGSVRLQRLERDRLDRLAVGGRATQRRRHALHGLGHVGRCPAPPPRCPASRPPGPWLPRPSSDLRRPSRPASVASDFPHAAVQQRGHDHTSPHQHLSHSHPLHHPIARPSLRRSEPPSSTPVLVIDPDRLEAAHLRRGRRRRCGPWLRAPA